MMLTTGQWDETLNLGEDMFTWRVLDIHLLRCLHVPYGLLNV